MSIYLYIHNSNIHLFNIFKMYGDIFFEPDHSIEEMFTLITVGRVTWKHASYLANCVTMETNETVTEVLLLSLVRHKPQAIQTSRIQLPIIEFFMQKYVLMNTDTNSKKFNP